MSQPNWTALVAQGRAKAHGVSWNEAELSARYKLGIPADYVRAGVLTKEDYEKALKAGQEPVEQGIVLSAPKEKSKKK